jgi:uncharacterized protein (DUF169 family)
MTLDVHRVTPTSPESWRSLSDRLVAMLKPFALPLAISFLKDTESIDASRRDDLYPEPNEYGRTGQVPAGCVFWIHGSRERFVTTASDHANCSVGSFTHGFLTLDEAMTKDDVGAVLESGWVDESSVASLPRITTKPGSIVYGPLATSECAPDVVLLRVNGLGLMMLKDALPELRVEGKPQCHIVAIAAEQKVVAASVGCALSRARTGMKADEMTCAIPGSRLTEVVDALEATVALNRGMATYASMDAKRFCTDQDNRRWHANRTGHFSD